MEAYRQQGDYLIESGRYADARKLGKEALQVADTTNRLDMRLLFDMLKRSAIWLNIPEEALFYSQEQIRMKESDLNQEWADKIAEVDAKYNTEKKELEIAALKADKKIKNLILLSLLLLLTAGGGTGYFIYRNQKQRHLLTAQRIKELEQEKQITATQSLLEGETTERARISRDLHDGLGGMLSVAKLKIATMKGNLTIPEENVAYLNSAIEMLDTSIKELRRVAHNLMPESLLKYGLNAALADFCRSTDKVTYHFFGNDRRPEEKTEVAAYRIVSELVNNSIDICETIHKEYPALKILALTSFSEFTCVNNMMKNGASGYVLKNAMPEEIIKGIETVMNGQIFLCHEVDMLMKKEADKHVYLTRRETDLLRLITEGFTNDEIAEKLFLGSETIKSYRKNLLFKLNAKNTAALVKMALEEKLV